MTIYCLYIFDRYVQGPSFPHDVHTHTYLTPPAQNPHSAKRTPRHCNCVYYHDWQHRTKRPKRANDGGALLPAVSHAVSPPPPSTSAPSSASGTPFSSPRNTLTSTSGVLVAFNDANQTQSPGTPTPPPPLPPPSTNASAGAASGASAGLPFDEEAKLVYGVVLSLRNMVRRLSGRCVPQIIPCTLSSLTRRYHTLLSFVCLFFVVHRISRVQGRVVCQLSYVNVQVAPLRNGLWLPLRHVK